MLVASAKLVGVAALNPGGRARTSDVCYGTAALPGMLHCRPCLPRHAVTQDESQQDKQVQTHGE